MSHELDYNIQHFNDLFIENLSQSLSAMLVKKPAQNDKTPKVGEEQSDVEMMQNVNSNNANITEFNPMLD